MCTPWTGSSKAHAAASPVKPARNVRASETSPYDVRKTKAPRAACRAGRERFQTDTRRPGSPPLRPADGTTRGDCRACADATLPTGTGPRRPPSTVAGQTPAEADTAPTGRRRRVADRTRCRDADF
eukprot:7340794-Prymnesium_polylepis.2